MKHQSYQLKKKNIRNLRRRRTTVVLVLLLMLSVTLIACTQKEETEIVRYETYVVKEGDTLWNVAMDYYGDDIDIRNAIKKIREINEISDAMIHCGDSLLVPIYSF